MNDACPIYLDEFVDPMPAPRCKHVFCTVCLGKWYEKGGTCPICRAPLEEYEEHKRANEAERPPLPLPLPPRWILAEWAVVIILCLGVLYVICSILRATVVETYHAAASTFDVKSESATLVCIRDYECPQARAACAAVVCTGAGTCETRLTGECASDADCHSVYDMNYVCDLERCACYDGGVCNYGDTAAHEQYTPTRVTTCGGMYKIGAPWFVYRTFEDLLEIDMQIKMHIASRGAVLVNIDNMPYILNASGFNSFTAFTTAEYGRYLIADGSVVDATTIRFDVPFVPKDDAGEQYFIGHFVGRFTRA